MSQSNHGHHESESSNGGNGDDDDVEEENKEREGGEDGIEDRRDKPAETRREAQRNGISSISRDFRNAIKRPFQKKRRRKKEEKEKETGDSDVVTLPSEVVTRRGRRRASVGGGCYICFMQPRTKESSPDTPTSDPNSESFSFEMLRTLIEKNDFYCKECNTHV